MEFPVDTRKIDFVHKEMIEKIRSEHGHILSSHAFASLYLWQHAMGLSLICNEDFFAVHCGGRASNTWFFPCGDERKTHDFIVGRMSEKPFSLRYLRECDVRWLEDNFPGKWRFGRDESSDEYICDISEYISLAGSKFSRKSVGGLIRNGADGAGFKHISLAEQLTHVLMGGCLILAGKVQVDIRYLVSLKAQKGLKRNGKTVLLHRRTADRTILVRHVGADGVFAVFKKLTVLAVGVWANVVRTERVDLGDVRQKCRKGGTDTASGTNQIPGVVRLLYQLMRNHIHDGISVFYNTVKLLIHPCLHNGRQHLAIDTVCLFMAHIHQILLTVFNRRRIRAVFHRLNRLAQIRNPVGVGDDDLFCLFFAEKR